MVMRGTDRWKRCPGRIPFPHPKSDTHLCEELSNDPFAANKPEVKHLSVSKGANIIRLSMKSYANNMYACRPMPQKSFSSLKIPKSCVHLWRSLNELGDRHKGLRRRLTIKLLSILTLCSVLFGVYTPHCLMILFNAYQLAT